MRVSVVVKGICCKNNSKCDHGQPQHRWRRMDGRQVLGGGTAALRCHCYQSKFAQKEAKPCNYKTQSNNCNACPKPRKKGPFIGQKLCGAVTVIVVCIIVVLGDSCFIIFLFSSNC
jgi:hypothetical protein